MRVLQPHRGCQEQQSPAGTGVITGSPGRARSRGWEDAPRPMCSPNPGPPVPGEPPPCSSAPFRSRPPAPPASSPGWPVKHIINGRHLITLSSRKPKFATHRSRKLLLHLERDQSEGRGCLRACGSHPHQDGAGRWSELASPRAREWGKEALGAPAGASSHSTQGTPGAGRGQTAAGTLPHLVPRPAKPPQAHFPWNHRLPFPSGSAASRSPQSRSQSQFPARTWRWARSGGLHQAAGIGRGKARLKPKPQPALPSRGRAGGSPAPSCSLGAGGGLQDGCGARATSPGMCPPCGPGVPVPRPGALSAAGGAEQSPHSTRPGLHLAQAGSCPGGRSADISRLPLILRHGQGKEKLSVSFRPYSSSQGTLSKCFVSITLKPCT